MLRVMRLFTLGLCLIVVSTSFAQTKPGALKIGVIMHDHGAPREHNADSYYGMKYFLRHLMMMNAVPSFLVNGFPFDPFAGNWGVILMDRNKPYQEVPWVELELIDAWGNDVSWLKNVDVDTTTSGIQPPYEWVPAATDMYGNLGHYRMLQYPYSLWFPHLEGFAEPDFYEHLGFEFYADWQLKGGVEVYFDQVEEQRQWIRDEIWRQHKLDLTGEKQPVDADAVRYIRITHGIDFEFPNSDPKTSRHAQSLYDAVVDLVKNVGVTKLVVNEYFVFFSDMMNDQMDRVTVAEALADLEAEGFGGIEVVWAPDKQYIGDVTVPVWGCSQWPPFPYVSSVRTQPAYVGGIIFNNRFMKAITKKATSEFHRATASTSGDIVFFLSNHGTPTTLSFCYDSANDYVHYSYKATFVRAVERLVEELGGAPPQFGPAIISEHDRQNLLSIDVLARDIQYASTTVDGRVLTFYRTAGQRAGPEYDPGGLVYSPREALQEVVRKNAVGANYTNVVDLLYNFFGDSHDILVEHRLDGYGYNDRDDSLFAATWAYCNPLVPPGDLHDCSQPQYAGLGPYESEFDWDGVEVRITNASWGTDDKVAAVVHEIRKGIKASVIQIQ